MSPPKNGKLLSLLQRIFYEQAISVSIEKSIYECYNL